MKVLFLTNNDVSAPLATWISERAEVITLERPVFAADVLQIAPDLAVSYSYLHIIDRNTLDLLPGRFVNLHISMLPWNRGTDPNSWSILQNTPKGVSIHLIDEGLDTGPILFQQSTEFEDSETLGDTYNKLQAMIQQLFKDNWPAIRDGTAKANPQIGKGSYHRFSDFKTVKDAISNSEEGWGITIGELKKRYQHLFAPMLGKAH